MSGAERAHRGQLVKNVSWLGLSLVVSKISTLLAVFVLGRYLGDELFGRFAVAFALPAALESLADLGISWAIVREGAHRRSELTELALSAVMPKLALAGLMVFTTVGLATVLGLPPEVAEAALYLGIARAFDSLTYLARAVFQANEQMQFDAASYTLDGAVRLILVGYSVASGFGVIGFAKALVVASMITMAGTWMVAGYRFLRPYPSRLRFPLRLLAAGLPLAVIWFLDSAVTRIGIIFVGAQRGDVPAGRLAAAMRIAEPMLSVPALLAAALLPLATRHIAEQRATLPWLLPASLRIVTLLAGAAAIILSGLAPVIVVGVFGPGFEPASPLLQVLALALVPLFMKTILIAFLLAMRAERQLIFCQVIGAVANLSVTAVLLPPLGSMAAVLGLLVGEWVFIGAAALVLPRLRSLGLGRAFVGLLPLAAGLAILIVALPLGELLSTAMASVTFVLAMRLLRVIDERDLAYVEVAVPLFGRFGRLLVQR